MALTQLALYNSALQLIGERRLNSLVEDQESRHELDAVWNLNAVNYCLEQVRPRFAAKTAKLESPIDSDQQQLGDVFILPNDFITMVELYSDATLDQPIGRYVQEGNTIICDYSVIYLRYISSVPATNFDNWSPTFSRVVAAYLASEVAERLNSDSKATVYEIFTSRRDTAIEVDSWREPAQRAKAKQTTLTESWLNIYNDALLLLGIDRIIDVNDDSRARSILDTAINADLVGTVLEDIGWHWAITSDKLAYDPSLEPEWGFQRAYRKPIDLHRFDGIWADEYFRTPIKEYQDEGDIIFCDVDEIFIQYVSKEFLYTPEDWKPSFRRFIAARLAYDTCHILNGDKDHVNKVYEKREREIKAIDAQQSPMHIIRAGNWTRSRFTGVTNRGRP